MVKQLPVITITQIAALADATPQVVNRDWITKPDFPKPYKEKVGKNVVYDRVEVMVWLVMHGKLR
jgi:hypothetical protein